jgi:hypothetical protein
MRFSHSDNAGGKAVRPAAKPTCPAAERGKNHFKMTNSNVVVPELPNGLPIDMLADKKVHLISDGALFFICTRGDAEECVDLTFFPGAKESLDG